MKKTCPRILTGLLAAAFMVAVTTPAGAAMVFGKTQYTYSTQAQPAKNGSYVDATYGTTITRVTNSAAEHGEASGTGCGYSTWSPESSDGNWLVFNTIASVTGIQSGGYALYTGAGTYVRMLTNYIQSWNGQDPEPRWDTSGLHPSWLYYRKDKQLRYVDVSDNTDHLVRDFSSEFPASGYYIYTGEEGTPSDDSRYWAFMVDNANAPYAASHIFVYDKTNNVVVASKSISGNEPNNVTMSRSGAYVYVAYDWNGSNNEYDGPHAYRQNLTTPIKMCSGIPHAVPAYSKQGNDVMFFMNTTTEAADMVSMVRMDNGAVTSLCDQADLGWDGSNLLHTAPGITKKGWGFVSTYSRQSEGGNNHWSDNQIFAIELDETKEYGTATEPRIWRLSFTQNMPNEEYYYNQPNAQMNLAGTKLWWGANWRNVNGVCEIYRLDLPQYWYEDLAGLSHADATAPYTTGHSPAKSATGVAAGTNIAVQVADAATGVNLSTVILRVNGTVVYNGAAPASYPNTAVTGSSMTYTLTYNPPADFTAGQTVSVTVDASDAASPANVMTQDAYSFTIQNTAKTITGTVRDLTSTAVNAVTMTLSGGASQTATTDSSGVYQMTGLTAGLSYTVTPSKTGYTFSPVSRSSTTLVNNATAWDFTATPLYYIQGYVRDGAGTALSGVTVALSGAASGSVTTGATGLYQFLNLSAGQSYTVTPSRSGYTFVPVSISTGSLAANWSRDFTGTAAAATYTISGYARTSAGTGISGVTMTLSGSAAATATTASDGSYQFTSMAVNGAYTLTPSKSGYSFSPVSVSTASLKANWSAPQVTGTALYTISGYARTSAGTGISGVTMTLSGSAAATATTASNGLYQFTSMAANGAYTLTPSKSGYSFSPVSVSTSSLKANWSAPQVTGTPLFTVSGYVRDSAGTGISGAVVTLSGGAAASVTTGSSGYFEFLNLPANSAYTLAATKASTAFTPVSASTTSLKAAWTTTVFTGVSTVVYSIQGYARDIGGSAMPGVTVTLSGGRSASALTDSSGAYQFTSLAGNADYAIVPAKTGYKFTPVSKNVAALSANVANVDFTALRKYYIRGKVKTLSGATISNVVMTLSGSESQSVVTDSNGEYLFEDLPENAVYTVIAVKSGYEFTPSERTTELLTSIDGWDFLAQDYGAMQKGEMIVIGSLQGQGTVNPDAGDTAKIFFKGSQTGTFDLHILTLTGEAVWETSLEAPAGEGVFEWVPGNVASGTYIAHIKGPGIDASKKIIILR